MKGSRTTKKSEYRPNRVEREKRKKFIFNGRGGKHPGVKSVQSVNIMRRTIYVIRLLMSKISLLSLKRLFPFRFTFKYKNPF